MHGGPGEGSALVVVVLALVAAVAGCSPAAPTASGGSGGNPLAGGSSGAVVVGSANFPEDELLAEIYAQALRGAGVKVTTKLNAGTREAYYPQVKSGAISVVPDYNGDLLTVEVDKASTARSTADVDAALTAKLPSVLTVLNPARAQDGEAIAVTQATAAKYHLKTIADLARYAKNMVFAGPAEFNERADGIPGLKATYGLNFKSFDVTDESGPKTLAALTSGQAQAAELFTTNPQIIPDKLVSLTDSRHLYAVENVIPLVYKPALTPVISSTLNAVDAKLTTAALLQMNVAVITEHASYPTVAAAFLNVAGIHGTRHG